MPEVGTGDKKAELDPPGHHGGRGQGGNRVEPRSVDEVAPAEVIVCPGVVEPVLLGALPSTAGDRPSLVGKDRDADAHPVKLSQRLTPYARCRLLPFRPPPWRTPPRRRPGPAVPPAAFGRAPPGVPRDGVRAAGPAGDGPTG